VSVIDDDILAFVIFTTRDIKNLTGVDIDEVVLVISEELPPLRVGFPYLQVV